MDTSLVFALIGGMIGIVGATGGMAITQRTLAKRIDKIDANTTRIELHTNSMHEKLVALTNIEAYARGKLEADKT
jgi:hypothetical protein